MPPAPPPAREEPPALLTAVVCGVCGMGGLGLLAWALASHVLEAPVRAALVAAGLALWAMAGLHWQLARRAQRCQVAAMAVCAMMGAAAAA